MMVTFVSQCEHKALNRSRRVLDAFANRIGNRTWQTVITDEGLQAVKKLLSKSATKNTAVSCHWIRSRSRSELVWLVGNREKFNAEGFVPVNWTRKNILNTQYENNWKYLPLIKALTALSALLHDWGKASKLFQEKLSPKSKYKYKGDPLRHEWISCLLLNALIQQGESDTDFVWLKQLAEGNFNDHKLKEIVSQNNLKPLDQLPMAAKLVAWLIVSHHRLPFTKEDWRNESAIDINDILKRITPSWGYENKQDAKEYQKRVAACFEFPNGLISQSASWMKQVKKWSNKLQDCLPLIETSLQDGSFRLVLHHSRLCLMLGDHYYSSQDADAKWKDSIGLFANTDRETNEYKQKLDEHLVGVAKNALNIAHQLPKFEKELPLANDIKGLRKITPPAFRWQNKAVEQITLWKKAQSKEIKGFFAVNMASTGCGKTFANAKVMQALSVNGNSLRYILALGLRTLTLQTGDEYRDRIGLDDSELAVLIGSKAVAELHNQAKIEEKEASKEFSGSESQESLLDEEIDYDCDIPEEGLATVLTKTKDRQFLYAPVLACTIDHIMAATETKRGGRYILPCLRLMSSDLVIDEIDDFTGSDLIAIGRLIHLAGMLGRKVMISSATIPPDLAEGYFNSYKEGWQLYSLSHNVENSIGCAWIDEFKTEVTSINSQDSDKAIAGYKLHHISFIAKRVEKLKQQEPKRKADIVECKESMENSGDESKQDQYFSHIQQAIIEKHRQHHTVDKKTQKAVSFGVVRVANISPCITLTRFLLKAKYPENIQVKVMAYHSQQVLLLRHEQEKHLDAVLKRKEKQDESPKAFKNLIIRKHLDQSTAKNIIFILVATPVEEVGRDHDFDWAVVEPSSYRSIIQLAGRVRRHRAGEVKDSNIGIMQYNWKAYEGNDEHGEKYFNRPGYEISKGLPTHNLTKLVDEQQLKTSVNAIPRIQLPDQPKKQLLATLEHVVTGDDLTNYLGVGPNKLQGYLIETWYLTAMPQYLNPFRQSESSINLFLTYDEDKEQCYFAEKDDKGRPINREDILGIRHSQLSDEEIENLWLVRDYQSLLDEYAEQQEISKKRISLRFGELNFIERENAEYKYNDQFGLVKI
ncbi:MAG TPA: type I-F CRISPR-associated helicase Cas3 [Candidatus Thioglobus autotrophicus]|nr:type I-F CRISPR-associated helicase Cas3 [Candidatus Thioglobus autotrophicus]